MRPMREFAETLLELTKTPWGPFVLCLHSFLESCVLPIAHDLFLVTLSIARPNLSFVFAFLSTVSSLLGGMLGYLIGHKGGRPIVKRFASPEVVHFIEGKFQKYDAWAIAIGAFTPIPYKVFAILGGMFSIDFKKFAVITFLARGARFFSDQHATFLLR